MARISLAELIEILKEHPRYHSDWEQGVPAEVALYIKFGSQQSSELDSEVLHIFDGYELVVDRDRDGLVHGIEIV